MSTCKLGLEIGIKSIQAQSNVRSRMELPQVSVVGARGYQLGPFQRLAPSGPCSYSEVMRTVRPDLCLSKECTVAAVTRNKNREAAWECLLPEHGGS